MYNKYNTYDVVNNCNVVFILKCNIIIGSWASTYTLLSVYRYLNEYYATGGVRYSSRGNIIGKCGYKLDYNHYLFTIS